MVDTIDVAPLHALRFTESRPGIKGTPLFDASTPTENFYAGVFILAPGEVLDMHYHDCEELQHVIAGSAVLRDSEDHEHALRPGTTFYCHAGAHGAHEIRNEGPYEFVCLYVYYSPGGQRVARRP